MLLGVEGDTGTSPTGSGSTTCSMDVGLSILRRLHLDDQVNVGDVESSRGHIGGNQNAELVFLESLQSDFSLVLSNISVHNLDVILNFIREKELISFYFSRCKHYCLSNTSVAEEDVC
jgi:hypothetical protein